MATDDEQEDAVSDATDLTAWRASLLAILSDDAGSREGAAEKAPPAVPRVEVLAFDLRRETYGIDIGDVAEILLPRSVTPLPRAPAFVKGVVSLRGTVLPVVDLARRLGMPPGEQTRSSRILVLRDGEERMGFWVDRVSGVIRFREGDVGTTDFASAVDSHFLKGIGYDRRGTLVAVLRPEALCEFRLGAP
jgi:purine-binding chemotaxis protein CheW